MPQVQPDISSEYYGDNTAGKTVLQHFYFKLLKEF